MEHARRHGFPVPEVLDVQSDALVLARIEGPTMGALLRRRPWELRAQAASLARLHELLHAIEAPTAVPVAGPGDRLLHLDLHPENVLVSPAGPVVIDWTNAARGDAALDVALTLAGARDERRDRRQDPRAVVPAARRPRRDRPGAPAGREPSPRRRERERCGAASRSPDARPGRSRRASWLVRRGSPEGLSGTSRGGALLGRVDLARVEAAPHRSDTKSVRRRDGPVTHLPLA